MKVLFLTEPLIFHLIPRIYPVNGDTLALSLRNEQTDLVISPDITFTVDGRLNITITEQPEDFISRNKYEVTVKNSGDLIYLGKIIILDSGTDVQNYEYASQTNGKFRYK